MKKLMNKKGFTLAELLIVVAIIGVLTVVAVPLFTTQLEKSKETTDIANLREAKAAAAAKYMEGSAVYDATTKKAEFYFDATKGELVPTTATVTGYGKGTSADGKCEPFNMGSWNYTKDSNVVGNKIKVTITETGTISMDWV